MEISIIPRWMIRYLSTDSFRQHDINILISNFLILSFFVLFKNSVLECLNLFPHFCLIDKLFGIQCPVCGTTRAFCELSNGNLSNAFNLNSASLIVALFFFLQIPLRIFSLVKTNTYKKVNLLSKYLGNVILLILLVNWIFKLFIKN